MMKISQDRENILPWKLGFYRMVRNEVEQEITIPIHIIKFKLARMGQVRFTNFSHTYYAESLTVLIEYITCRQQFLIL